MARLCTAVFDGKLCGESEDGPAHKTPGNACQNLGCHVFVAPKPFATKVTVDLAAIRKRAEAATPDWQMGVLMCMFGDRNDAKFAYHARKDIPALLVEIEGLRAQRHDVMVAFTTWCEERLTDVEYCERLRAIWGAEL
jgi:hypothetical protein